MESIKRPKEKGGKSAEESPVDPFAKSTRVKRSPVKSALGGAEKSPALEKRAREKEEPRAVRRAREAEGLREAERTCEAEKPSEICTPNEASKPNEEKGVKEAVRTKKTERSNTAENSEKVRTPGAGLTQQPESERTSPTDEHIVRARIQEEEELAKCKRVLVAMQAAVRRQPNTSADIKRGITLLEESLSVIADLRSGWKTAEKAKLGRAKKAEESTLQARTPSSKRAASSPVEQAGVKKKKGEGTETPRAAWTEVVSKKSRRTAKKKERRTREESQKAKPKQDGVPKGVSKKRRAAISIKPASGKSYAEVLKDIKSRVNPENVGAEIKAIRRTKEGNVLLELGAKTGDPAGLKAAISTALGDSGTVRNLVPRMTVEVRDLDCLTEREEIEEALKRDLGDIGEVKVRLTPPNLRSQRAAIVELAEEAAVKLLKIARLKVGWIRCRVRQRAETQRCFNCLGYGHTARACKGPDRSKLCYRCGQEGHVARACSGTEHCVLCAEVGVDVGSCGHTSGTGRCRVFREALQKARSLVR